MLLNKEADKIFLYSSVQLSTNIHGRLMFNNRLQYFTHHLNKLLPQNIYF